MRLIPGAEGGGFHLYGVSSLGKTTALHVAGSVWGGGTLSGFVESWKATATGMELKAALHNDGLLLLDEIAEVSPKEVPEIIYALSNGRGKARGTKTLNSRQTIEYRLLYLSTGERQQTDLMSEVGRPMKGGQEARMVQIEADARKGWGVFEDLHGFESPLALQQHLKDAARRIYGTPILEYLNYVVLHRQEVADEVGRARQDFSRKAVPEESSNEVIRVGWLMGVKGGAKVSHRGGGKGDQHSSFGGRVSL